MKLQHITLLSLVAAMLGLMTACSKKAELLDTVPASSAMVTTVDLKAICERSGLEFTAEGIKASPETSGKLDGNIKAALDKLAMLDAKGVADLSTIVVGQDTKEGAFLTFSITDFERFKLIVEDAVTWSDDADGMHCGSLNRIPVAANDHQVWMLMNTNGSATGIVKKLLEQADEMPVSKLEGIAQSLYRDNLINTAVVNGLDPFNAKSESDVPVPEKVWNVAALNTSADSKSIAQGTVDGGALGIKFDFAGAPQSGDQFVVNRNNHQSQNALDTISQLRKALEIPSDKDPLAQQTQKDAINSAIGNLKNASAGVDSARGSIGARLKAVDIQADENISLGLANDSTTAAIGNTDMAGASIELAFQKAMLEASQLAFVKISQLSLFNQL